MEYGPSLPTEHKATLSGFGRSHVTQFQNSGTPYNFRTNTATRFKFDTDIEDGPILCMGHKATHKWAWPGSCYPISIFWDLLIAFERIKLSASNLVQRWRTDLRGVAMGWPGWPRPPQPL